MIGERKPSWRNSRIHALWMSVRNGAQRYFTPIPGRIRDFQRSSLSPRISGGKSVAHIIAGLCIHLASTLVQVTTGISTQARDSSYRVHKCLLKMAGAVDVVPQRVFLSLVLTPRIPRESAETTTEEPGFRVPIAGSY